MQYATHSRKQISRHELPLNWGSFFIITSFFNGLLIRAISAWNRARVSNPLGVLFMKEEDVIRFHEMMADVKAENRLNPVKTEGESKYAVKLPTLKKAKPFDHFGNLVKRIEHPFGKLERLLPLNDGNKYWITHECGNVIVNSYFKFETAKFYSIENLNTMIDAAGGINYTCFNDDMFV